jgi:hypothetical protein
MSLASTVPERFARWLDAQGVPTRHHGRVPTRHHGRVPTRDAVALYRRVFAGIWVVYDVVDLVGGMTERERVWFPHARSPWLLAVQAVLIVSGLSLALGWRIWGSGMVAAAARATEAFVFFSLNDFFFGSVVYLLLAHSDGGPFERGRRPKWVRDVLLFQLAWIYFATGVLKLNPDWLDGGQLFVRTQYLWDSHGWPFPAFVEHALSSQAFDARLSQIGATLEIALGVVLFARRSYGVAAALAIAIHTFGALVTNVWFFTASMAAGVLILLPRSRDRQRPEAEAEFART